MADWAELEQNCKELESRLVHVFEPCTGDEVMTYVYSVKPELKESVTMLLKESCNPLRLANELCSHGILEAEDCYL